MKIQPFTPSFTGNNVKLLIPRYKQNSGQELLFNKVSNILKENKLPAEIRNDRIDINIEDAHYQTDKLEKVTNTLHNLGIYFEKTAK